MTHQTLQNYIAILVFGALLWGCDSGMIRSSGKEAVNRVRAPRLKSREMFYDGPDGTRPHAVGYYTRGTGVEMRGRRRFTNRSDVVTGSGGDAYSKDNGRSWGAWNEPAAEEVQGGRFNGVSWLTPWVDPGSGRLLYLGAGNANVFYQSGKAVDIMKKYFLVYGVSTDGGRSLAVCEPVIQKGADYTAEHPLQNHWVGKNCVYLGDNGSRPIRTRAGRILVPIQYSHPGPDGEYLNLGGGYTFHDSAVLIGQWGEDMRMDWEVSEIVYGNPAKSTRGFIEPTLAEMPDGRILMVMRGSNDKKGELPGHKWYCVSEDGGYHWSEVKAWGYADGRAFYSPSSMSLLLSHSNGRIYWLGNICAKNPLGNSPRYPMVIGQVDEVSMQLIRETVSQIDTRTAEDAASGLGKLNLSNFYGYEDRENGDIVVWMTRSFNRDKGGKKIFNSDAYVYRIEP